MQLSKLSKHIPYFYKIIRIAKKHHTNIWLVGGILRDMYLRENKEFFDFDFCIEKNIITLVREFTRVTRSKYIVLDEGQQTYRVIIKKYGHTYTYDFTLMRGKDFEEDLSLRDFSINTLATNLNSGAKTLIDCFHAQEDLRAHRLKVIKAEVLAHDSLRVLRGFSFMANYGFSISAFTKNEMVKHKGFLKNVSGERINEELFKIFNSTHSYAAVKLMSDLKVIDEIIPSISSARGVTQGSYHHLDVWSHSLQTLNEFERLYRVQLTRDKEVFRYLNEELTPNRRRLQVIKLACILHDIGKPIAKQEKDKKTIFYSHEKIGRDIIENIAGRLKLSVCVEEVLKKLVFWHLRPGYLADQITPSRRAVYRFFRDAESEGVGIILLSLADWRATRGPSTDAKKRKRHERIMLGLVKNYFKEKKKKPLKKIIDGYDIMKKFCISASPLVGKILKKIKEEQALGKVKTKTDAYKVATKVIKNNGGR